MGAAKRLGTPLKTTELLCVIFMLNGVLLLTKKVPVNTYISLKDFFEFFVCVSMLCKKDLKSPFMSLPYPKVLFYCSIKSRKI